MGFLILFLPIFSLVGSDDAAVWVLDCQPGPAHNTFINYREKQTTSECKKADLKKKLFRSHEPASSRSLAFGGLLGKGWSTYCQVSSAILCQPIVLRTNTAGKVIKKCIMTNVFSIFCGFCHLWQLNKQTAFYAKTPGLATLLYSLFTSLFELQNLLLHCDEK